MSFSSLVTDSAPFRRLLFADLPAEWQAGPSRELVETVARDHGVPPHRIGWWVAVELPDVRGSWCYERWWVDLEREPSELLVFICANSDFRGLSSEAERLARYPSAFLHEDSLRAARHRWTATWF